MPDASADRPPVRPGTPPADPKPQRSDARSNRARILDEASRLLTGDPEAPLDEIADAAGVARRTLYGHFPNRAALLDALAQEAAAAVTATISGLAIDPDEPELALARFLLAIWPVADRYRILFALGKRHLAPDHLQELIAPARRYATELIRQGQLAAVFTRVVAPSVLNDAMAAMTFSLLDSVSAGEWDGEVTTAATFLLTAAGVPSSRAASTVRRCVHGGPVGSA